MASQALDFFGSLTPIEAAVLWFSGAPATSTGEYEATLSVNARRVQLSVPVPGVSWQSLRIAISKETLVLAAGLAASYVRNHGDLPLDAMHSVLADYTTRLGGRSQERPLAMPSPDKDLMELLQGMREARLLSFDGKPDRFFEIMRGQCAEAIRRLEEFGLVEDPPWKKISAGGALMVLLGVTPVDFAVRTERGDHLVRTIQVDAPLYTVKRVQNANEDSWQVNIRAVDWVGDTLSELAEQYLERWKHYRAGRLPEIPSGRPKLDSE